MKAQRSWRSRAACMFAGESTILVLWLLRFALFHALVSRSENLEVYLAQRKLSRSGSGCAGFDFVDPIEKPSYGCVIAAGGLCSELHGRCLDFRDITFFSADGGTDLVARGIHQQRTEIFRA